MKRLFSLIIFAGSLSASVLANVVPDGCERLETYEAVFDLTTVQQDLVTGAWNTDLEGHGSTLFFLEDGTAELILRNFDGEHYHEVAWNLKKGDSAMLLTVEFNEDDTRKYILNPTCDGFAAKAMNGEATLMYKEEMASTAELKNVRDRMMGSWRNEGKTATIADGDLQWTFGQDGRFLLTANPDDYHGGYSGMWDISKDSEYLILHFVREDAPGQVFASRMIKLHSVDFEDMVVSGGILARFTGSGDGDLKLHFEKAF